MGSRPASIRRLNGLRKIRRTVRRFSRSTSEISLSSRPLSSRPIPFEVQRPFNESSGSPRRHSRRTSYLRAGLQVRVTMVEQGTYDEYIQSLPTPTVIYVVGLAPLPGQAVVELNLPVARVLIDRLLGGTGSPAARTAEMTEIELALLKTIGQFILSSLREA